MITCTSCNNSYENSFDYDSPINDIPYKLWFDIMQRNRTIRKINLEKNSIEPATFQKWNKILSER